MKVFSTWEQRHPDLPKHQWDKYQLLDATAAERRDRRRRLGVRSSSDDEEMDDG